MPDSAIHLEKLGKMYKLYERQSDKVLDALGMSRFLPRRRNRYREFWALRDLDLTVHRGERLGIIGRNGAGKSTLLKIITSNINATEGTVRVAGAVQALFELGTGFHPEFTGRQNIHASLSYQGFSAAQIRIKEEEIIEFSELEEFIEQPVKTYSAGMYARLAFSAATVVEPEVLIIDEVLGAGDAYFAGKCVERMRRLTEQSGATVLFVSHDLGSVQQLCERVIWIDRGRIRMDGAPLEVTKAYYASIMAQEEIRLRSRNARLGRKQVSALRAREEGEHVKEVLFRFVPAAGTPPKLSHPVRRIVLESTSGFREEIVPGRAMDDDASQVSYLMTAKEYMLWSEPVVVDGERLRCVEATGGSYVHAPFVFAVPVHEWLKGGFQLSVEHHARPGEEMAVEFFDADRYHRMGVLSTRDGGWQTQALGLPAATVPGEVDPTESGDAEATIQDKWATAQARFESVATIDGAGVPKQIFRDGEPFGMRITALVNAPLSPCWLAIVLYHQRGQQIAFWTHRFEAAVAAGRPHWDVMVETPNLRQGDYVASVELLSHFDPMATEKLPYYCHWNRCVVFRIDESYLGHIPLGLVHLPFELRESPDHDRN